MKKIKVKKIVNKTEFIKTPHAKNARSASSCQCLSFVSKIVREGELTISAGSTYQVFPTLNWDHHGARTDLLLDFDISAALLACYCVKWRGPFLKM